MKKFCETYLSRFTNVLLVGCLSLSGVLGSGFANAQAPMPQEKIDALKVELAAEIDKQQKMTQEMVDMVFSFGETYFNIVQSREIKYTSFLAANKPPIYLSGNSSNSVSKYALFL